MAVSNKNKLSNKPSGSRIASIIILALVISAISGYFLFRKTAEPPQKPETVQAPVIVPRYDLPQKIAPLPPAVTPSSEKKKSDPPPVKALPEVDKLVVQKSASGRIAVIVDDMGSSMSEVRSLAAIKVPLTFAIIPGLRADSEVAAFAAANGFETMIHVPMQPKGWPKQRMELNGLLVAMDESEIRDRMSGYLKNIPKAVGVNNHMGSEFTEHEEKMTAVLQTLKRHNLFFIDSMTSAGSVGGKVAKRLGVRTARRNVFLDNEQNRSYITGQLDQAIRLAKKSGSAIVICHPHQATIATLAAALPGLAGNGIKLVHASQLVQ